MIQYVAVALLLVGGAILTHPTNVSARCYGSGVTFRCDPIITPRYTPRYSGRYKYEGRTFSLPSGLSMHRYKYKSGGRTYKGTIETFPGGAVRHRGRWK